MDVYRAWPLSGEPGALTVQMKLACTHARTMSRAIAWVAFALSVQRIARYDEQSHCLGGFYPLSAVQRIARYDEQSHCLGGFYPLSAVQRIARYDEQSHCLGGFYPLSAAHRKV